MEETNGIDAMEYSGATQISSPLTNERKPWRKILYENQHVPDNYVDESFLEEMKKNLYIRTYDFWTVVKESGVVTQQLCSVCIFLVIFVYMDANWLAPEVMFVAMAMLSILGYLVNRIVLKFYSDQVKVRTVIDDTKTACIFVSFGFVLSPILMTLTKTISTDTIYAMSFFMLLTNLLFHDYGTSAAVVSQSVSLNAAIFASVCLASRLSTVWHAFALTTFAVQMFALWPVLRRNIKSSLPRTHSALTILLDFGAVFVISSISLVAAILFALTLLFISLVCPAWLIHLQPYKNNIHGPWDEAIIKQLTKI